MFKKLLLLSLVIGSVAHADQTLDKLELAADFNNQEAQKRKMQEDRYQKALKDKEKRQKASAQNQKLLNTVEKSFLCTAAVLGLSFVMTKNPTILTAMKWLVPVGAFVVGAIAGKEMVNAEMHYIQPEDLHPDTGRLKNVKFL